MYTRAKHILTSSLSTVLILFMSFNFASGQNYTLKTFTVKDGLPHNNIRSILRDSTGFLWIATWDGLSRYDGYEFRNYYHIPDDTASLPYFAIRDVSVDGANNLWVMTDFGQLALYDRANDHFDRIPGFESIDIQFTKSFDNDKNGNLWIICQENIFKRDPMTGTFEEFRLTDKYQNPAQIKSSTYSVYLIDEDEIWICGEVLYHLIKSSAKNNGGFTFIVNETYTFFPAQQLSSASYEFDDRQWAEFFESSSGNRWVFSNNGLFKQGEDGVFREFRDQIPVNEFTRDRLFIWGSEKSGLFVYDPTTESTIIIPAEISQHTFTYFCQNKNLIWFSNRTFSGNPIGLTQLIISPGIFRNYKTEAGIADNEAVFSLFKDNKSVIWAGVRGKDHIHLINPDGTITKSGFLTSELKKKTGHLRAIVPGIDGIWLGYYNDLLLFYDYRNNKFVRHYPDSKYFHTILANPNGSLYIGSDNIVKYDPKDRHSEILWEPTEERQMYCFYSDSTGILWAGLSFSHLLRYDTKTAEYELIKVSEEPCNIEDICPGDNNDLWIALLGGGVCNYNLLTKERKYYTTSTGLSNNTTYSLLKDNEGYIWVSTNHGISRIDPKTDLIRSFNQNDGLDIIEFNSDASFESDDGEFFFGGMGGFTGFYPDSILQEGRSTGKQRLLLTELKVSGEIKVLSRSINEIDTIILKKGKDNFHLTFSSTDFINSDKAMYRYKLSGVNDDWVETDSRNRNINYSNLKPGWYTLHLDVSDVNGKFDSPKNLTVRISPFFYQTKFFLISGPLLVLVIIVSIIILYIRQIEHRERAKQDELRLNSLRGQMNPHFIFNSLNSINYFISNNDRLSANSYIADFSRLIRTILSNLGSNYILFETEIRSLQDYLRIEHLRFGDKFDYEIKTEEIGNYSGMEVMPGLVQPFIENAIWHGVRALEKRKGKIVVRFLSANCDRIKCIIEDDGIGRSASWEKQQSSENHKSRGIGIAVERLQIISKIRRKNFELEISDLYPDRIETGTRVKIDLPVKIN